VWNEKKNDSNPLLSKLRDLPRRIVCSGVFVIRTCVCCPNTKILLESVRCPVCLQSGLFVNQSPTVHNCVYRMVVLNSDHCFLPPFRSRSSAKNSQIPRPTRNRTQSSSPGKDASTRVVAASVRRSRSNSNLPHIGTPMTPKCWSGSIPQTAQSSR
jgi:hypothetical protein